MPRPEYERGPTQVLVLVLADQCRPDDAMQRLQPLLHAILPPGIFLDVWPLPADHTLLPAIRGAGCALSIAAPPN